MTALRSLYHISLCYNQLFSPQSKFFVEYRRRNAAFQAAVLNRALSSYSENKVPKETEVKRMQAYRQAVGQIPGELGKVLAAVPAPLAGQVQEIRLRAGYPPVLTLAAGPHPLERPVQTPAGLQRLLEVLCGYSIYSWQESICQGYITLPGGHRVGIAGKIAQQQGKVLAVQPVTGLNIRIARNIQTTLPADLRRLLAEQTGGVVLAGAPGSGKTTVLRQVIGFFSRQGQRVCVVDERSELAGFAPPLHCDVLENCPKALGLLWAVRSLSPQVLVCDEIGGGQDAAAVCAAAGAGVRLVVTMHGETQSQLRRRPPCRRVLETGAFAYAVFLRGAREPGQVREVEKL